MNQMSVQQSKQGPRWRAARLTALLVVLGVAGGLAGLDAGQQAVLPPATQIAEVRKHIKTAWSTLTRSNRDLPAAAIDPKLRRPPGSPWPVYVSRREDRARVEDNLRQVLGQKAFATIALT